MRTEELINGLNAPTKEERLANLKELVALHKSGVLPMPKDGGYVNSHIHTTYSFSPYSPTKAVYMAWVNGLTTAGIVDHDSVGGCREFIEAGKIVGMITTIGMECRVSFKNTPLVVIHTFLLYLFVISNILSNLLCNKGSPFTCK